MGSLQLEKDDEMISREELLEIAEQVSLRPQVVEKDYVLGWILAGISRDPFLSEHWIFKGGTCLKKCYFETYRFSEDLDFTITDRAQIEEDFLLERFKELSEWLYDETGILLPVEKLKFDVWYTPTGNRAAQGKVSYSGPIAPKSSDLPRIKLDLTSDELIVLPKIMRSVVFPYSDIPEGGVNTACYSYAEIFAEKVRALLQRTRPRDLYDVINLFRHEEFNLSPAVLSEVIKQKCDFKGLGFPSLQALQRHKNELFTDWSTMLAHQLPQLPPVESFWTALDEFFNWLDNRFIRTKLNIYPQSDTSETFYPSVGKVLTQNRSSSFIEVIRFAASNRLCAELDYTNQNGERHPRLVEPYSLRRTKEGNVLLMAVEADSGLSKSYRVDQIHGVKMTSRSFIPKYQIELSPFLPISTPDLNYNRESSPFASPILHKPANKRKTVHIYRCSVCGKKFERSSKISSLKEHKSKSGNKCNGRFGVYEGSKIK